MHPKPIKFKHLAVERPILDQRFVTTIYQIIHSPHPHNVIHQAINFTNDFALIKFYVARVCVQWRFGALVVRSFALGVANR